MAATTLVFFSTPLLPLSPFKTLNPLRLLKPLNPKPNAILRSTPLLQWRRCRRDVITAAAGDDGEDSGDMGGGGGDFESGFEDDYVDAEEADNKPDYEVEYSAAAAEEASGDDVIEMVAAGSFHATADWEEETVVNFRIDEDEFHKITLLHCDFFIRKGPDPDDDVYDFREMYVTPPDTDVYSIPKVLSPVPQKYTRCTKTNYGCYNVTEPPIDGRRGPMFKSEREVLKVFLTKHYRNRRTKDAEFVLDFEEIYVIDSKMKSITRAKVVVTIPEGKDRDRSRDLLIIRDGGNSFKIIDRSKRNSPTTVIEKEEWIKSRKEMEAHLSKLRDYQVSNWF